MPEYESGTFRCEICAKEFLTKDDADKHYLEVHAEEEANLAEWLFLVHIMQITLIYHIEDSIVEYGFKKRQSKG